MLIQPQYCELWLMLDHFTAAITLKISTLRSQKPNINKFSRVSLFKSFVLMFQTMSLSLQFFHSLRFNESLDSIRSSLFAYISSPFSTRLLVAKHLLCNRYHFEGELLRSQRTISSREKKRA